MSDKLLIRYNFSNFLFGEEKSFWKVPKLSQNKKSYRGLKSEVWGGGGGLDEKLIIAGIFLFKGKRAYRRRG